RSGPGRGSGTVGRGGMSVAGEARDEQRDQPRLGIPGRRPTLPGGLRLPLAAAVLGILLAGIAVALRSRPTARPASVLTPSAPAVPSPTDQATPPAESPRAEPPRAEPQHIAGTRTARAGRSRRRPAQRATLAASLLT